MIHQNKNMKCMYVFFILFLFYSCTNFNSDTKKKFHSYYIVASENKNGNFDGIARYYNYDDKLISFINYVDGVKHGKATNYFINNNIKDSFEYHFGNPHGYWYHFDSLGKLNAITYYYHGIKFGPEYLISDTINKFYFSDFGKYDLVYAEFDPINGLSSLDLYKMKINVRKIIQDGKDFINLFSYLPKIPESINQFAIGVVNKENIQKELFKISSEKIFIDTLLPTIDDGYNYYISAHIQSNNGLINRIYIENMENK